MTLKFILPKVTKWLLHHIHIKLTSFQFVTLICNLTSHINTNVANRFLNSK